VAAGDDARVHVRASSPHEKERNPFDEPMWIGWGLFGGALVGGTITGIGAARSEEGFASPIGTVTIGLGIAAAVAGLVATYFTIRASRWKPARDVSLAFDGAGLRGTF
jgi:hypothetical protein